MPLCEALTCRRAMGGYCAAAGEQEASINESMNQCINEQPPTVDRQLGQVDMGMALRLQLSSKQDGGGRTRSPQEDQ